jgi:hypothetical protein
MDARALEVAIRAWAPPPTERHTTRQGTPPEIDYVLVFDTETTTDPTQALLFGDWRTYQVTEHGWDWLEEGILVGDDLAERDPAGYARIQAYSRTHRPAVARHRHDTRRTLHLPQPSTRSRTIRPERDQDAVDRMLVAGEHGHHVHRSRSHHDGSQLVW